MKNLAVTLLGASLVIAGPAAHAASYQTVVESYTRNAGGQTVDATPQCPGGFTPISGGWNVGDPNRIVFRGGVPELDRYSDMNTGRFAVVGSHPNGNGWRTYGYVNGPTIINIYTVCASP